MASRYRKKTGSLAEKAVMLIASDHSDSSNSGDRIAKKLNKMVEKVCFSSG